MMIGQRRIYSSRCLSHGRTEEKQHCLRRRQPPRPLVPHHILFHLLLQFVPLALGQGQTSLPVFEPLCRRSHSSLPLLLCRLSFVATAFFNLPLYWIYIPIIFNQLEVYSFHHFLSLSCIPLDTLSAREY